MRHSWMKIGNNRKECARCGMIATVKKAPDGYNNIWTYRTRSGKESNKVGECKF